MAGFEFLASSVKLGANIKLRVLDINKAELIRHFECYSGSKLNESPLFNNICHRPFHKFDGEPFGLLIGDYYFTHEPADLELLRVMSRIAAVAHAPFTTGAAPPLFGLKSWKEVNKAQELKSRFNHPEYAAWNSLCESDDSKFLCLTLPRFLARLPHSSANLKHCPWFHEDIHAHGYNNFQSLPWANSAFAFASNVARSFQRTGWFARIRGVECGGEVDHTFCWNCHTADGGIELIGPAEVAINFRREYEFSGLGLISFCNYRNTRRAMFITACSLHQPRVYHDDASATSKPDLPEMLCSCRFMHYLVRIFHDEVGPVSDREILLQDWITSYINPNWRTVPDHIVERLCAGTDRKDLILEAQVLLGASEVWNRPLEDARVLVNHLVDSHPASELYLMIRPRYQIPFTSSIHLVAAIAE